MLPDFPALKKELKDLLFGQIPALTDKYMGAFSGMRKTVFQEGNLSAVVREDGKEDPIEMQQMSGNIEVKYDQLRKRTIIDIKRQIHSIAEEIAPQTVNQILSELRKATDKSGNVVDMKNSPFSIEAFFQMLEKIEIDFNESGEPDLENYRIVVGEALIEQVRNVMSESENNPEHKKRFRQIMIIKKEEWRAKEANRKLVD
jgi:hypothetical protein